MLNKYRSWCQKWGQLWGFGTIISYLVGFTIIFEINANQQLLCTPLQTSTVHRP